MVTHHELESSAIIQRALPGSRGNRRVDWRRSGSKPGHPRWQPRSCRPRGGLSRDHPGPRRRDHRGRVEGAAGHQGHRSLRRLADHESGVRRSHHQHSHSGASGRIESVLPEVPPSCLSLRDRRGRGGDQGRRRRHRRIGEDRSDRSGLESGSGNGGRGNSGRLDAGRRDGDESRRSGGRGDRSDRRYPRFE